MSRGRTQLHVRLGGLVSWLVVNTDAAAAAAATACWRVVQCSALLPRLAGWPCRVGACLFDARQPTQNWHGLEESDCLIKTKHCDVC